MLVGSTIGSGIFRVPASVAGRLTEPGPFLLAWVIGGLIALFGALTYAELAAALPRSGGVFAYILEAFGPLPAFLFGWSELAVIRASALGAISTIFAEYLGYFLPLTPRRCSTWRRRPSSSWASSTISGSTCAAVMINLTTVVKYGALVGLAGLAFLIGEGTTANFAPCWGGGVELSVMATALISIMWTYDGWADLSFVGGEVRDPATNLPPRPDPRDAGDHRRSTCWSTSPTSTWCRCRRWRGSALIAATAAERIPLFGGGGRRRSSPAW